MAWANGQGKNRGRVALAVFSGLDSLVALAVVFLVFNPASSRHYPCLHAEQVLAGLGGDRLGSGL